MRNRIAVLVVAASLLTLSGCHHRKGGYLIPGPAAAHATR